MKLNLINEKKDERVSFSTLVTLQVFKTNEDLICVKTSQNTQGGVFNAVYWETDFHEGGPCWTEIRIEPDRLVTKLDSELTINVGGV